MGNLYAFYRCKCGAGVPISFFKKLRKRIHVCAFRVVTARERKLEIRHGKRKHVDAINKPKTPKIKMKRLKLV